MIHRIQIVRSGTAAKKHLCFTEDLAWKTLEDIFAKYPVCESVRRQIAEVWNKDLEQAIALFNRYSESCTIKYEKNLDAIDTASMEHNKQYLQGVAAITAGIYRETQSLPIKRIPNEFIACSVHSGSCYSYLRSLKKFRLNHRFQVDVKKKEQEVFVYLVRRRLFLWRKRSLFAKVSPVAKMGSNQDGIIPKVNYKMTLYCKERVCPSIEIYTALQPLLYDLAKEIAKNANSKW